MSNSGNRGLSNWIDDLPCPLRKVHQHFKELPRIEVNSPELTVSFYKEYLGFKAFKIKNLNYLIFNGSNIIHVSCFRDGIDEKINSNFATALQIKTNCIENDYTHLKEKAYILDRLTISDDGIKTFSIKDCNGIKLVYKSN